MRRIPGFACGVLLMLQIMGCGTTDTRDPGPTYVAATVPARGPAEGKPTLGEPILIPLTPHVLVPFAIERELRLLETNTRYGASSWAASDMKRGFLQFTPRGVTWHNVVFATPGEPETTLLLNRRGLIIEYLIPAEMDDKGQPANPPAFLYFSVVLDDTNNDGRISRLDARTAFLTNPDGSKIRAISPPGIDASGFRIDKPSRSILLMLTPDTNGDGKFDTSDNSYPAYFRDGMTLAQPLVDPDAVERAKSILVSP